MKRLKIAQVTVYLISIVLLSSVAATAANISYSLADLGSGQWQIDYQVTDFDSDAFQGFQLLFDYGLYDTLVVDAYTDEDWDVFDSQPVNILGAEEDGFIDAEALTGGILTGDFSVTVSFLGEGLPGVQEFLLYDADYETIARGTTSPVPVPGTFGLLMAGLAAVAVDKKRKLSV